MYDKSYPNYFLTTQILIIFVKRNSYKSWSDVNEYRINYVYLFNKIELCSS